jgi:hypothetical protein
MDKTWNRNCIVGVVTAYGLDDRGFGVRAPAVSRIFCSPRRLNQCSATGVPRHTGVPSQGERCDANYYLLYEINCRILFVLFYPSYRVSYTCILFSTTVLWHSGLGLNTGPKTVPLQSPHSGPWLQKGRLDGGPSEG